METLQKVVQTKKSLWVVVAFLGAAISLRASTVCPTDGTFAKLEALGSCSVGNLVYDNFSLSSPDIAAEAVDYTTVIGPDGLSGFTFEPTNFFQLGIGVKSLVLGFDATGTAITAEHLAEVAPAVLGGVATIGNTSCSAGDVVICPAGSTRALTTETGVLGTTLSDNVTFAGVHEVGALNGIFIVGVAPTGFVGLSAFSDTFNSAAPVPEPGFYGLLAGGLAGIFLLVRRSTKKAA